MAISDNAIVLNYRRTSSRKLGKIRGHFFILLFVSPRLPPLHCAVHAPGGLVINFCLLASSLSFCFAPLLIGPSGFWFWGRRLLWIDMIYLEINFSLSPFMSAAKHIYHIFGEISFCLWSKPLDFRSTLPSPSAASTLFLPLSFAYLCAEFVITCHFQAAVIFSFNLGCLSVGRQYQTISPHHVIKLCYMCSAESSFEATTATWLPCWRGRRSIHHHQLGYSVVGSRLVSFVRSVAQSLWIGWASGFRSCGPFTNIQSKVWYLLFWS